MERVSGNPSGKKLIQQPDRPKCTICNTKYVQKNGISTLGFQKYKKICEDCAALKYNKRKHGRRVGYRIHKKIYCEICGFIAVNKVQLDVHHIDGCRENNSPSNLQTLCANCHRLKTYQEGINPR